MGVLLRFFFFFFFFLCDFRIGKVIDNHCKSFIVYFLLVLLWVFFTSFKKTTHVFSLNVLIFSVERETNVR